MSTKHSYKEFVNLVQNDQNLTIVQDALQKYPDLANIKNGVSSNQYYYCYSYFN